MGGVPPPEGEEKPLSAIKRKEEAGVPLPHPEGVRLFFPTGERKGKGSREMKGALFPLTNVPGEEEELVQRRGRGNPLPRLKREERKNFLKGGTKAL